MNTALVRTHGGRMVHRADCPHVQRDKVRAMPWNWADSISEIQIAGTIKAFGYSQCKHCQPISPEIYDSWVKLSGMWFRLEGSVAGRQGVRL